MCVRAVPVGTFRTDVVAWTGFVLTQTPSLSTKTALLLTKMGPVLTWTESLLA